MNNNLIPSNLQNPCLIHKATKNKTELEGSRKAHLRDGVSITKFLYWLKNHHSVEEENEISVANKLLFFRKSNELFHSVSFDSISAIGKNAALLITVLTKIIQYHSTIILFIYLTQVGSIMMEQLILLVQ